jgi:hypothetical protein
MADMKIEYEQVLARRKGQPPLPTAVVYPCSEDALIGAVDAAEAGLIAPLLVGPKEQIGKAAGKAKVDVSPYEIVAAADAEESASVAANLLADIEVRRCTDHLPKHTFWPLLRLFVITGVAGATMALSTWARTPMRCPRRLSVPL